MSLLIIDVSGLRYWYTFLFVMDKRVNIYCVLTFLLTLDEFTGCVILKYDWLSYELCKIIKIYCHYKQRWGLFLSAWDFTPCVFGVLPLQYTVRAYCSFTFMHAISLTKRCKQCSVSKGSPPQGYFLCWNDEVCRLINTQLYEKNPVWHW